MRKVRRFSLMELMIVLGLILFLAALTVPAVGPMLSNARLKMGASAIKSCLDLARSIAIANGDVARMVIGFDPNGNMLQQNITMLTGKPYDEGAKIIDVNGDGIAHWYQSDNYKWFKFYLVKEFNDGRDTSYLELAGLDPDAKEYFGPFWMHRPIMQKDLNGNEGVQRFLAYKHVYKLSATETYHYRTIVNRGSFDEVPDTDRGVWLAPLKKNADDEYESLLFTGDSQNYPFGENSDVVSGVDGFWDLYLGSAQLYEDRNSSRLALQGGSEFAVLRDTRAAADVKYKEQLGNKRSTAYVSALHSAIQLVGDDDEDGEVDEGMGVYAQKYDLKGSNMPIVLPMYTHLQAPNTYNYYFGAHEDVNISSTKEYKISGPYYSEEMLRRVWVMAVGETEYTLVWKFDSVVDLKSNSGQLKNLEYVLPYFMAVIFDAVDYSISFQSTYGSVKIERVLFQLSDLSASKNIYVMYRYGQSWSGELKNSTIKSTLPDVYEGELSQ